MVYAQFYHRGALSGIAIEACGSDSVFRLDARKKHSWHSDARARGQMLNKNLGTQYIGYLIMRGESFTRSRCISSILLPL